MENDKLFHNIKKAAENPDSPKFDSMDRVWGKVEAKLDNVALKKQTSRWKQLAIAASVLLVATLGYLLSDVNPTVKKQVNVVSTDSVQKVIPIIERAPAVVEKTMSPEIKPEASAILEKQLFEEPVVLAAETSPEKIEKSESATHPNSDMATAPKFESRGVTGVPQQSIEVAHDVRTGKVATRKADPLVVVDGKAITKDQYDVKVKRQLSTLSEEEVQDIVVLPNPLYIINGTHYTEEELFGVVPSSPYAPLNEQEIESLSILQGKQATDAYGEKGSKGVVIITTKNGKPAKPKGK